MSTFDTNAIDITADLTDGSDGAFVETPANTAQMAVPQGTQPVGAEPKPAEAAPAAPAAPKPESTLRDQLSSAFKGTDGAPVAQDAAPNAAAPNAAAPAAPALVKDGDGKYRTPDGLFASNEQIAAFEAATSTAQPPPSSVFTGLTPIEQQQFQSLPAELRQYVERTMEGLNTRASAYKEYDVIEQSILGPRRAAFAAEGTNPIVALNQLFAMSDFAGRDPGAFVLWYADQQKLDLDKLLDERDAATRDVDPVVRELQGKVQELTGTVQQFQQRDVQAVQQANFKAVENFASEKDPTTGALKRPYITDVVDAWASNISALRAANPTMPSHEVLEQAYNSACWSSPAVRAKMQQAQQQQQAQVTATRVATAKQAGGSVVGGPAGNPGTQPNNSNRTLRDELESQFAQARA